MADELSHLLAPQAVEGIKRRPFPRLSENGRTLLLRVEQRATHVKGGVVMRYDLVYRLATEQDLQQYDQNGDKGAYMLTRRGS